MLCVEIELDFQTIPPEFPSSGSVKDLFRDLVILVDMCVKCDVCFVGTTAYILWG